MDVPEYENGNGALMRILPLAYYFEKQSDITLDLLLLKHILHMILYLINTTMPPLKYQRHIRCFRFLFQIILKICTHPLNEYNYVSQEINYADIMDRFSN